MLPLYIPFEDNQPRSQRTSDCQAGRKSAERAVTLAFDTSSRLPLSWSHICRDVLLPCGCPVWSKRPMMVNVTLKTCSTRGLAHFSSSSLSSGTVNSSTVAASGCCLAADEGTLLVGCSGHVSSVTRLIPRRGRVVDIPLLGLNVAPDSHSSVSKHSAAIWDHWQHSGLLYFLLLGHRTTFETSNVQNSQVALASQLGSSE